MRIWTSQLGMARGGSEVDIPIPILYPNLKIDPHPLSDPHREFFLPCIPAPNGKWGSKWGFGDPIEKNKNNKNNITNLRTNNSTTKKKGNLTNWEQHCSSHCKPNKISFIQYNLKPVIVIQTKYNLFIYLNLLANEIELITTIIKPNKSTIIQENTQNRLMMSVSTPVPVGD